MLRLANLITLFHTASVIGCSGFIRISGWSYLAICKEIREQTEIDCECQNDRENSEICTVGLPRTPCWHIWLCNNVLWQTQQDVDHLKFRRMIKRLGSPCTSRVRKLDVHGRFSDVHYGRTPVSASPVKSSTHNHRSVTSVASLVKLSMVEQPATVWGRLFHSPGVSLGLRK